MKFRGLVTGVTAAALLLFVCFSSPAHAWTAEECRRVVLSGNEYKFKAKTIDEMIHNIETMDLDHLVGLKMRTPWEMGMIPNLTARKMGYQYQLKLISSWVLSLSSNQGKVHGEALEIVRDILSGSPSFLSRLPVTNSRWAALIESSADRDMLSGINPISEWLICSYYQPEKTKECYSGLKHIIQEMAPVQGITARDRIDEVLKNPSYQLPLSKLALEYIDLIEKGLPIQGRKLDEDLLRALGSETRKWNVLAVLSTRGANFYKLFDYASKKDFRTIAALGVISSAALYFDSLNEEIFSFPRGVRVDCDSGKSYHFWMSAYLARRYGSKWAAYLSDVGYQMKSKTEFRNPNRAFTDAWDSPANQKIRLDLAYSVAGAEYGMSDSARFNLNISSVLDVLVGNAERLPPISDSEASFLWRNFGVRAFFRWNQLFHPEKAMN